MEQVQQKLYLNMIVAETEPVEILKRGLDSLKDHVDGIYITLTYKDKQPESSPLIDFLKSYNVNVSFFKWTFSFADARNFALSQIPNGKDIYFTWIDADDVVQNAEAMKKVMVDMAANNISSMYFPYWYGVDLDQDGNVREILIEHKRERIIKNDGTWKWVGMLHETLIEQRQENIVKAQSKDFIVVHLSDPKRVDANLDRNIEILEKQAEKEQHKDPRTVVYLAKAYTDKAKIQTDKQQQKIYFDMALMLFTEYLEGAGKPGHPGYIEGSGWPEERATAWNYVGEIVHMNGQHDVAINAYYNALIEDPTSPMYYINLAMVYAMKKDWPKAKHWLNLATNVREPDTTLITTPRDLKARALQVDYHIAIAEGRLDHAVEDAKKLCDLMPDDEDFKNKLITVNSVYASNKAAQSVVYLGKYLEQLNESEKLPLLVKAIPNDLQNEKFASEMRHRFVPARNWGEDEITILCGPGFEQWSPKSIKTGLGGSEEAVVYLSKELTKLGWKVTVYANPMQDAGDHEGVTYAPWYDLNLKDRFNVLIVWRGIGFVDFNPRARFKMIWMHDVPTNPDFTQERIQKLDKIAPLSEYHKSLFRMNENGNFVPIPEEKFFVTSNGMTLPVVINKKWKRDPKRMIYASSPDRGLIYLLNNWPLIKKSCPDVKLDVYYGFDVYDAIHGNNPARQRWKNTVLDMMKQDGITYMGRVGHAELNKAYATAGIWAYPTDFTEISCISAMKAQAMGAIPVCTDFAALKETVKNGIRLDVDIQTPQGQQAYVEELVKLLNDDKKQEEIRSPMMDFAQKQFGWDKVAKNWDELFKQSLKNK